MDRECSWKRTEEIEIDMLDLLRRLCLQWKRITVCALIFALMAGGVWWIKGRSAHISEPVPAQEEELSEEEFQQVADALRLKSENSGLETYLENSVLMQADPYHKTRYIMLYRIDHAKRQELAGITESFLNYIANGGAADALEQLSDSWKVDKSYMAERISAYPKTYSFSSVVTDGWLDNGESIESLFYLEITGKNAREAKQLALDMQDVLKKYSGILKESAGGHRLALLNCMESVVADSGLLLQQNDRKALLSSNKAALKTMTEAFSEKQLAVYQESASVTGGKESVLDELEDIPEQNSGYIKYALLGFFAGVLAYCCIFAIWYLFSDTIKSTGELKRLYVFPVYGTVKLNSRNRKNTRKKQEMDGQEKLIGRLRISCQKQEIKKFCAVSDFLLYENEKECLENIAQRLQNWGIDMKIVENAIADAGVLENLLQTEHILFVARTGTTTHRMMDDVMEFCLENRISVAGMAVFT